MPDRSQFLIAACMFLRSDNPEYSSDEGLRWMLEDGQFRPGCRKEYP